MKMGWISVYRNLTEKPIWLKSTPEHKCVLITLLLMANYEAGQWEWEGNKFKVDPGQFVTSLESIKVNCGKGVSLQNIRSALVRFEKLEFLTNKSTKTGRLITICNWERYQTEKNTNNIDDNKEVTKKQQTGNKQVTPNNKDNKDNNTSFDSFWNLYDKKIDKPKCQRKWGGLGEPDRKSIIEYIPKYKEEQPNKKFRKHPCTFLNNRSWENELVVGQTIEDGLQFYRDRLKEAKKRHDEGNVHIRNQYGRYRNFCFFLKNNKDDYVVLLKLPGIAFEEFRIFASEIHDSGKDIYYQLEEKVKKQPQYYKNYESVEQVLRSL